jgi:hypothetical protein
MDRVVIPGRPVTAGRGQAPQSIITVNEVREVFSQYRNCRGQDSGFPFWNDGLCKNLAKADDRPTASGRTS